MKLGYNDLTVENHLLQDYIDHKWKQFDVFAESNSISIDDRSIWLRYTWKGWAILYVILFASCICLTYRFTGFFTTENFVAASIGGIIFSLFFLISSEVNFYRNKNSLLVKKVESDQLIAEMKDKIQREVDSLRTNPKELIYLLAKILRAAINQSLGENNRVRADFKRQLSANTEALKAAIGNAEQLVRELNNFGQVLALPNQSVVVDAKKHSLHVKQIVESKIAAGEHYMDQLNKLDDEFIAILQQLNRFESLADAANEIENIKGQNWCNESKNADIINWFFSVAIRFAEPLTSRVTAACNKAVLLGEQYHLVLQELRLTSSDLAITLLPA